MTDQTVVDEAQKLDMEEVSRIYENVAPEKPNPNIIPEDIKEMIDESQRETTKQLGRLARDMFTTEAELERRSITEEHRMQMRATELIRDMSHGELVNILASLTRDITKIDDGRGRVLHIGGSKQLNIAVPSGQQARYARRYHERHCLLAQCTPSRMNLSLGDYYGDGRRIEYGEYMDRNGVIYRRPTT